MCKYITLSIVSFLLCSFKPQTKTIETPDTEEFNSQINQLDEELDKKNALQDEYEEYADFENELIDDEKCIIQDFIHIEENHIELYDGIYQVMPTNDNYLSINDYKELTGLEYQLGNNTYLRNYRAISFVNDNINLMNELANDEYGIILDDGIIEYEFSEYSRRSTFGLKSFSIGWFKISFVTDWIGTSLLGALGIFINFNNIKNLKNFMNADYSELEDCFQEVAWDLLSEGESYFSSIFLDSLTEIISTVLTFIDAITSSSLFGIIKIIATYILGHYLPGFLKGIVLILSGLLFGYPTLANVGIRWSSYDIIEN